MGVESIPGVVSIVETDYTKNGKWSNSDYEVILADGADAVIVRQNFATGKFFSDTCMSWAAVGKELGLPRVSPMAVEAAVRENWPNHARRLDERIAALIELEDAQLDTNTVSWTCGYNTRRIGSDVLLVDGELFTGESIPGKVVVLSAEHNGQGGRYASTKYTLEVTQGVEMEYLTEGGFPGEDCLEERGWTREGANWVPPQNASNPEEVEKGNIDLSALNGLSF
jgi:membrane-bound inhibitor of C-type lysozyme